MIFDHIFLIAPSKVSRSWILILAASFGKNLTNFVLRHVVVMIHPLV